MRTEHLQRAPIDMYAPIQRRKNRLNGIEFPLISVQEVCLFFILLLTFSPIQLVNATRDEPNALNTLPKPRPTSNRSSLSATKNASPVPVVSLGSSIPSSSPSASSASRHPSLAPAELTTADQTEHLSPSTIEPVSAAPDLETHRAHWAFVAEITPVLDQIYSGGPDHLRRSVMEDLEQDNILPAYHVSVTMSYVRRHS
jgi:hypothetical protein